MNKDTKKQLLVVVIALVMFFSSAAWIIISAVPLNPQSQGQNQVPENLTLEGLLSDETANQLLQNGFSLMEWHYYAGCCPDLQMFVDSLPGELDGQLVVQRLSDAANSTWATARSLRGEQTWNVTNATDLLPPLCNVLLKPPIECGLMQLGNGSR